MSSVPLRSGEGPADPGSGSEPGRDERLRRRVSSHLSRRYRPILIRELSAWRVVPARYVEDVVHEFILRMIVGGGIVECYDRRRGRMRTLILSAFRRFVLNVLRDRPESLLPAVREVRPRRTVTADIPEKVLEVRWAGEVLSRSMSRARLACWESGDSRLWRLIELRIVGPIYFGTPSPTMREVARLIGYDGQEKASNDLKRARRLIARELRGALVEAGASANPEESLRDLWDACASAVRERHAKRQ